MIFSNSKIKVLLPLAAIVYFFVFLLLPKGLPATAQGAPDAIAIRIVPNSDHYSAIRWYKEQNFSGSPQSITVDGYEAVRDGRSVYVNAANVKGIDLHTYIYLISYNQDAQSATMDIFGQVLSNWHFNTDLPTPGNCSESADLSCLIDPNCPVGEYCNSQKSKVIRDTKRLADLMDINLALNEYYGKNKAFPALSSGSYLPNKSLSVWPSWQKVLGYDLGVTLPIDPINKLGSCTGFNQITCWNEVTKRFSTDLNIPSFPIGSRAYFYSTDAAGSTANYCALMETTYANIIPFTCALDSSANNEPSFKSSSLTGVSGEPFNGFVEAVDPDGDNLIWTYTPGGGYGSWNGGNPPRFVGTPYNTQGKLYSISAGNPGLYTFQITVDDNHGGVKTQTFNISIINNERPQVTKVTNIISGLVLFDTGAGMTAPFDISVVIGSEIKLLVEANDPGSFYPLVYDFDAIPAGFNSKGSIHANQHDFNVSGPVIAPTGEYSAVMNVSNNHGIPAGPVYFKVRVTNNPPSISSAPIANTIGCTDYSYQVAASDPDGHKLTFSADGLPQGLSINPGTGLISGQARVPAGAYPIKIMVRDEYYSVTTPAANAETIQEYTLNVINEAYTITAPADNTFYVSPDGMMIDDVYYLPTMYFNTMSKSTDNQVVYSQVTVPAPLAYSIGIVVHPGLGEITAYSGDMSIPVAGYTFTTNVTAKTLDCNVVATDSFNLTVKPNAWCNNGAFETGYEQCDGVGGLGTSAFDQYECDPSCTWTGGWCGNGNCEYHYESYLNCLADCDPPSPESEFSVCTTVVDQPACYPAASFISPTINWSISSIPNEFCDCDGIPVLDCPTGSPCEASYQEIYRLQVDNDLDFSSPEFDSGLVTGSNSYHKIVVGGLTPNISYYYRVMVRDQYGTWSSWAMCTGPFTANPRC